MQTRKLAGALATAGLVAVGLFATIGEGSTTTVKRAPNAAPVTTTAGSPASPGSTAAPTTTTAPGSDKADAIPVGTPSTIGGWEIKVNSSTENANSMVDNEFEAPDAGKQYLAVNITATNKTGKPDYVLSSVELNLLPSSGIPIDEAYASVPDACDPSLKLQPDAVYTCNMVFQVAPTDAATSIIVADPMTFDDTPQRFFNLK